MRSKVHLTTQRKAVYEVIRESNDHPTAAAIIERLRDRGHNFAYGTIYNSLRYLTDVGLIRELKVGDAASRYDANVEEHHHIMCRVCGKIDEVNVTLPEDWLDAVAKETNYVVDAPLTSHQVVLKGVCPCCRNSARNWFV